MDLQNSVNRSFSIINSPRAYHIYCTGIFKLENAAGMHTDLCYRIVIGKKKIASRRIIFWRIVFEAPFGATYSIRTIV